MLCKEKNCEKKVVARGWCSMHYSRWRRSVSKKPTVRRDSEFYRNIRAKRRTYRYRGYFSQLKDQGRTEEIKRLSHQGAEKRWGKKEPKAEG